jgi:predicted nucleotidyltransferase
MDMIPGYILMINLKRVSIDLSPDIKIDQFRNSCIKIFGDEIAAVVLTGSYAKGDFTPKSDIDIWVIFNELKLSILKEIASIIRKNSGLPEINAQCITTNELLTESFRKCFSPVQIYVDGIVLYGRLPEYQPYNSEIKNYALAIAVEVFMGARHYITTGESEESLASGRLVKWVIKPLTWVFRYNILLSGSDFPRNMDNLLKNSKNENEIKIINAYKELLECNYKGSFRELNELCCETAVKLSKI